MQKLKLSLLVLLAGGGLWITRATPDKPASLASSRAVDATVMKNNFRDYPNQTSGLLPAGFTNQITAPSSENNFLVRSLSFAHNMIDQWGTLSLLHDGNSFLERVLREKREKYAAKNKPLDLEAYFRHFEKLPAAEATYEAEVYVDVPDVEKTDLLIAARDSDELPFDAGHVFIRLTKTQGSRRLNQVLGFYPEHGLRTATLGKVQGRLKDDGLPDGKPHDYDASIRIPGLSATEFNTIQQSLLTLSQQPYTLHNFNCATIIADAVNEVRPGLIQSMPVYLHDPFNLEGATIIEYSPTGIYRYLCKQKTLPEEENISIGAFTNSWKSAGPA